MVRIQIWGALILIACLLLVGCTTEEQFEEFLYSLEPVQEFLEDHPQASLKVFFWDSLMIYNNQEYIKSKCNYQLPLNDYYHVTVEDDETALYLWVDIPNELLRCLTVENKVQVPEEIIIIPEPEEAIDVEPEPDNEVVVEEPEEEEDDNDEEKDNEDKKPRKKPKKRKGPIFQNPDPFPIVLPPAPDTPTVEVPDVQIPDEEEEEPEEEAEEEEPAEEEIFIPDVEVIEEVDEDFDNLEEWSIVGPWDVTYRYPNVDDGILTGIGQGYDQSLEPWSRIHRPIDVDASEGFELEIRARSGPGRPNAVTAYLYSDDEKYLFRIYGESSNYNLDWYKHDINGDEEKYRHYVGPGLLDEWHTYKIIRDHKGKYTLFIDGEEYKDFKPDDEKDLTEFDHIAIQIARIDSQVDYIKFKGLEREYKYFSDEFDNLDVWSSVGLDGREYRFPTLEDDIIRGQGSGYSNALEPWPTMFREIDIDASTGFVLEVKAVSASSWPNAAMVYLYDENGAYYYLRLYGESSNYNIDWVKSDSEGNSEQYRYYIGPGVLNEWHVFSIIRDEDGDYMFVIDGAILEDFQPDSEMMITEFSTLGVVVAREGTQIDYIDIEEE
tara:strand:- start:1091 stop:2908 length:1818 start_codon:yes stop_codon:yes gene_type:complete